jgi:hypothetical protein
LEGLLRERLNLNWSGYLRVNEPIVSWPIFCPYRASQTGSLAEFRLPDVLDQLGMGFSVEVIKGCEVLRKIGWFGKGPY